MKNPVIRILILLAGGLSLTSCATDQGFNWFGSHPQQPVAMTEQPPGDYTADEPRDGMETVAASGNPMNTPQGMDSVDRSKMTHALDSPIGKSTHWVNQNSGTSFTVVPQAKVTINGNPYCRHYNVIAERGERTRETSGTACVGANGTWEEVGS